MPEALLLPCRISPAQSVDDGKAWLQLTPTEGPGNGMEAIIFTQQTCLQGLGREQIRPMLHVRAVAHRQAPERSFPDAQPSVGAKRKLSKLSRVSMPLPEGLPLSSAVHLPAISFDLSLAMRTPSPSPKHILQMVTIKRSLQYSFSTHECKTISSWAR